MIKSMTGYGRARQELHKRDITVEVRSVNNRYLDCTVKMPRMYAFAEDAVKKHVQQAVSRGKVDVFITVDATAADVVKVAVNRELAAQYAAALGELSDVCGTADYRPAPETLAGSRTSLPSRRRMRTWRPSAPTSARSWTRRWPRTMTCGP